ncbi:MAG: helix-turn-helix transcriptional regulator [Phycisphaerae bacterium]|nr:helix-turn-helix transcriptional regulator [Phycisphaerae bacterium]
MRRFRYPLDSDHPLIVHANHYDHATSPDWDVHAGLEMGVILRGKVNRWQGRYKQTLTRGEVWLCNAWEPHGFSAVRTPVDLLEVMYWPAGLAMSGAVDRVDYLQPFRLPAADRPAAKSKATKRKMIQLAEEILALQNAPLGFERQALLVKWILLELIAGRKNLPTGANSATGMERILPALQLVQDHPTRRIPLDEAARACHISTPLLVRLFRTMMGASFAEYARRRRLAALAAELRSSGTKISALAKTHGFIDAPHLNRIFKSAFGMTPGEYRGQSG